jgi:flagellar basal-body rod protein FlgF
VTISADGILSQAGQRVGRIGVVGFESAAVLQKVGDNLYQNTSNATAQPVTASKIRQGMLEGSNVQPIAEITRMIEVQRAYESMARMMDSNSDLSRRSVERMGRVS